MDKKNTVFLTVIAVATLLVAVVGATFAYFTAQMGEGANTNIVVTTSTQDTLSYGSFTNLFIEANEENFQKNGHTQKGTAGGTISLQANSNDTENFKEVGYCYTATINISANQFEYAPDGTIDDNKAPVTGKDKPELILTLSKNDKEYGNTDLELTYKDDIGTKNVCDQTTAGKDSEECEDEAIKGFDVTEYGNTEKSVGGSTEIKIPYLDADEDQKSDATMKYVHKISAQTAGAITKDVWSASLYFVNYDWDQQYNTHKMFVATWKFETVKCEDGQPIKNS